MFGGAAGGEGGGCNKRFVYNDVNIVYIDAFFYAWL